MKSWGIRLTLVAMLLGTAAFAALLAPTAQAGGGQPGSAQAMANGPISNLVVKSADLDVLAEDTDIIIGCITRIASDAQGYVLAVQSWYEEGHKDATMTIGVPAGSFETALQRVRAGALKVLAETGSGEDLTGQYDDLDSQLRNLQTEEARIRSFLDKATTIDEALRVNQQLETLVGQMGEIQGQMQYLSGRAAFGTITVDIQGPRPTPTPLPTKTPTQTPVPTPVGGWPTPTLTPTPTPAPWLPGQTYIQASGTLASVARWTWETLIWVVIVPLPIVAVVGGVVWGSYRLSRRVAGG